MAVHAPTNGPKRSPSGRRQLNDPGRGYTFVFEVAWSCMEQCAGTVFYKRCLIARNCLSLKNGCLKLGKRLWDPESLVVTSVFIHFYSF